MCDWDHEYKGIYHHISSVLAEDHEVVYIEKLRYFSEIFNIKLSRFLRFLTPARKVKENLLVITPPPSIPFIDKLPLFNKINDYIFLLFLKRKLKKINFKPTILWLYSYYAYFTIGKFGEDVSIYYCCDPFFLWELKHNVKKEKQLCRNVDLIFTPSTKLTERKKQFNSNSYTILHGVDLDIFCEASPDIPEDLKNIKKPVIGFVGNMFIGDLEYRDDQELIKYIADKRPDWSIVLVGPLVFNSVLDKKQWKGFSQKNIHLLGKKDVSRLPSYIHHFDVAIIPFHVNEKNTWVTVPVKFLEYLVMGKPVVTTHFSDFEGLSPEYYETGYDYDDFIKKIEKSLSEDSPEKAQQRKNYAKGNSWEKRIEQILEIVNKVRGEKQAQ
jgi:glycosyltransferase involved in cell wall biosynthesis